MKETKGYPPKEDFPPELKGNVRYRNWGRVAAQKRLSKANFNNGFFKAPCCENERYDIKGLLLAMLIFSKEEFIRVKCKGCGWVFYLYK